MTQVPSLNGSVRCCVIGKKSALGNLQDLGHLYVLGLQFLDLILALRKEVGKALGQGPSGRKALKLITKEALRNRERHLPKVEDTSQKNKTPSNKTEGIDVDWTSDSALGGGLQLH
jgi:hypothetical protein